MKKQFSLSSGMDVSIVLQIDTEKLTAEVAKEINEFWSGADSVLDAAGGCVFTAVARRATGPLLGYLMEGYNPTGAVFKLSQQEGWPDSETIGITILDHEIPDFSADTLDVIEIGGTP